MRLNGRVARLEAVWTECPATAADQEQGARYQRLWLELLRTMAPAHVARMVAAAQARGTADAVRDEGATRLLQLAEHLVALAAEGRDHFRLALPPAVATVYLERGGWPFDRCERCHLGLPYAGEHWRGGEHVPAWHAFSHCPDCGDVVAFYDYGRGDASYRARHSPPRAD